MKIFIVAIFILFSSGLVLSQDSTGSERGDSSEEGYWSTSKLNFSFGMQSLTVLVFHNNGLTYGISYVVSSFFYSFEETKNQIGLFNELGINNMSVFFQFGPEIRFFENIYIIPKAGVSYILMAGIERSGVGFTYFYGGKIGYIYPLNKIVSFYLEGGTDFIQIGESITISFARIGVSYKFLR